MTLVETVRLREILDSRGDPTVEAEVVTEAGTTGRAAAPSGASTGAHEAVELPASEAIAAAREEAVPRLEGRIFAGDQRGVDRALVAADGTEDFSGIGANSAVAISMATASAGAATLGIPLYQHLGGAFRGRNFPIPLGNVLGGGAHATKGPWIQEFLAVPVGAPSVADAVFANAEIHRAVATELAERDIPANKGDEGAWAPDVGVDVAFDVVETAVDSVADSVGFDIQVGVDMAAAEVYDPDDDVYRYGADAHSPEVHRRTVVDLVETHDLQYVEDPLDEDDFEGFAALTEALPAEVLVCGDDLFVTDVERIERGVAAGAGNAVLIKPNQNGTLSGTVDAIEVASRNGYVPVVSHRSGETGDTTIAHLAVATDAGFIKTGTVGGERTAKLNELIRIAEHA